MASNQQSYRRMLVRAVAEASAGGGAENTTSQFSDDVQLVIALFGALSQCLLVFFAFYLVTKIMDRFLQPEEDGGEDEVEDDEAVALRSIGVVIYEHEHEHEHEACSICLEQYGKGEELRLMPRCKHAFHRECIDRWLLSRSSFCPICRDRVIERSEEPSLHQF